jgi:CRP-like cAMP-binding protein
MDKIKLNINQSVFKVGELPDKMYLLVKGSIGIYLPTNETKKPNFIIQENELFGEMGVIENELRMATARCLMDSEIISITKDEFDKRVNSSDVFVKGSLKALSYRLRAVEKKL